MREVLEVYQITAFLRKLTRRHRPSTSPAPPLYFRNKEYSGLQLATASEVSLESHSQRVPTYAVKLFIIDIYFTPLKFPGSRVRPAPRTRRRGIISAAGCPKNFTHRRNEPRRESDEHTDIWAIPDCNLGFHRERHVQSRIVKRD